MSTFPDFKQTFTFPIPYYFRNWYICNELSAYPSFIISNKQFQAALIMVESKREKSFLCSCFPSAILLFAAFFVVSALVVMDHKQRFPGWQVIDIIRTVNSSSNTTCQRKCMADGSEALPRGIVARTTNMEMRTLWEPVDNKKPKPSKNLLAIAVGLKQKDNVNQIINKFPLNNFVVVLFHYDGNIDGWGDLEWSTRAIHISAINQTKWWFAKRFLHPDVIADYAYIFLWDEDLGVKHFNVDRYLSIVKEQGLEISQPAIDADVSEVHYKFTARERNSTVHRSVINPKGPGVICYGNSTEPPCTGFVEMMAPVFSRVSWRCAWYMIQNDLTSGWGVDFQLGYCAQAACCYVEGNRTKNVGIVDSEYILHYGIPTLGGSPAETHTLAKGETNPSHDRTTVRKQSYVELDIFKNRWNKAVKDDQCWVDPFHS